MSQREANFRRTLQCLVVGFTQTIAPLNSMAPAFSEVIRLTTLVVGIYAARSVLNFLGTSSITENHAARDGGGIYTRDGSAVNLLGSSNYKGNLAGDTGGGISAFQSSFKLAGQNKFESNKADKG